MNSQVKRYTGSVRVLSTGASVPVELGVSSSQCGYVHQFGSSLNCVLLRVRGASSHRHDQLFTPFPAPLLSLEKGGGAEDS